ncbi:MAG: hypothetical protein GKS03_07770 [Alphaproteobacteria bacterium]|nr:hypothetical protein [Alphaproteobacteria bacterium]
MDVQNYLPKAIRAMIFAMICTLTLYAAMTVIFAGVDDQDYADTVLDFIRIIYAPMMIWAFVIWFFWPNRLDDGQIGSLIFPSITLGGGYGAYLVGAFSIHFGKVMNTGNPIGDIAGGVVFGLIGGAVCIAPFGFAILICYSKYLDRR